MLFIGKTFDCSSDFCYNEDKKKAKPEFWRTEGLAFGVHSMDNIIAKKSELIKSFWLYFHLNDSTAWIEHDLPTPTLIKHINRGAFVGWAIDGYFGTNNSKDFLNDIIARILITFKDENIRRLSFKPSKKDLDEKTAHIFAKVYKLKEFSKRLNSLPIKKKYSPSRADAFEDFTFWAIKLYAEDQIRAYGQISYGIFESWALSQFEDKERSTIRAKCRNIYAWYESRDWELPSPKENKYQTIRDWYEESRMTRAENMKRVSREKAERNRRAIINIMTGLYSEDYKKKNGAWHFGKIAEATNLSSKTVAKIIKEIENKTL